MPPEVGADTSSLSRTRSLGDPSNRSLGDPSKYDRATQRSAAAKPAPGRPGTLTITPRPPAVAVVPLATAASARPPPVHAGALARDHRPISVAVVASSPAASIARAQANPQQRVSRDIAVRYDLVAQQ